VVEEERQGRVTEWCCCESKGGFWTNPECVLRREEERERDKREFGCGEMIQVGGASSSSSSSPSPHALLLGLL
jgi:hypothetical protein